jgi:glutamate synthase (NADPH/NADH) small chain
VLEFEINYIKSLGVKVELNMPIGLVMSIKDLFSSNFSSIFLGLGAGLPQFLNIEGENLNGIYSANEFLTRVNLMHADKFPLYDTPIYVGKKQ